MKMSTTTVTRNGLEQDKARALDVLSKYTGPEYTGKETDPFLQMMDSVDPAIHLAMIARSNKLLAEMDLLGVDILETSN